MAAKPSTFAPNLLTNTENKIGKGKHSNLFGVSDEGKKVLWLSHQVGKPGESVIKLFTSVIYKFS
jgi:hypothetical protein